MFVKEAMESSLSGQCHFQLFQDASHGMYAHAIIDSRRNSRRPATIQQGVGELSQVEKRLGWTRFWSPTGPRKCQSGRSVQIYAAGSFGQIRTDSHRFQRRNNISTRIVCNPFCFNLRCRCLYYIMPGQQCNSPRPPCPCRARYHARGYEGKTSVSDVGTSGNGLWNMRRICYKDGDYEELSSWDIRTLRDGRTDGLIDWRLFLYLVLTIDCSNER